MLSPLVLATIPTLAINFANDIFGKQPLESSRNLNELPLEVQLAQESNRYCEAKFDIDTVETEGSLSIMINNVTTGKLPIEGFSEHITDIGQQTISMMFGWRGIKENAKGSETPLGSALAFYFQHSDTSLLEEYLKSFIPLLVPLVFSLILLLSFLICCCCTLCCNKLPDYVKEPTKCWKISIILPVIIGILGVMVAAALAYTWDTVLQTGITDLTCQIFSLPSQVFFGSLPNDDVKNKFLGTMEMKNKLDKLFKYAEDFQDDMNKLPDLMLLLRRDTDLNTALTELFEFYGNTNFSHKGVIVWLRDTFGFQIDTIHTGISVLVTQFRDRLSSIQILYLLAPITDLKIWVTTSEVSLRGYLSYLLEYVKPSGVSSLGIAVKVTYAVALVLAVSGAISLLLSRISLAFVWCAWCCTFTVLILMMFAAGAILPVAILAGESCIIFKDIQIKPELESWLTLVLKDDLSNNMLTLKECLLPEGDHDLAKLFNATEIQQQLSDMRNTLQFQLKNIEISTKDSRTILQSLSDLSIGVAQTMVMTEVFSEGQSPAYDGSSDPTIDSKIIGSSLTREQPDATTINNLIKSGATVLKYSTDTPDITSLTTLRDNIRDAKGDSQITLKAMGDQSVNAIGVGSVPPNNSYAMVAYYNAAAAKEELLQNVKLNCGNHECRQEEWFKSALTVSTRYGNRSTLLLEAMNSTMSTSGILLTDYFSKMVAVAQEVLSGLSCDFLSTNFTVFYDSLCMNVVPHILLLALVDIACAIFLLIIACALYTFYNKKLLLLKLSTVMNNVYA